MSQYYWEIKWHKKLVSWYSPIFCRQDSNLHHGLTFLGHIFDFCFLQQRQSEPQNGQPICLNNMCETKSILNLAFKWLWERSLPHFCTSLWVFNNSMLLSPGSVGGNLLLHKMSFLSYSYKVSHLKTLWEKKCLI